MLAVKCIVNTNRLNVASWNTPAEHSLCFFSSIVLMCWCTPNPRVVDDLNQDMVLDDLTWTHQCKKPMVPMALFRCPKRQFSDKISRWKLVQLNLSHKDIPRYLAYGPYMSIWYWKIDLKEYPVISWTACLGEFHIELRIRCSCFGCGIDAHSDSAFFKVTFGHLSIGSLYGATPCTNEPLITLDNIGQHCNIL